MKRRDANAILIAFAGMGGAIVAYSVPTSLYELAFSSSGISELITAARPPLGNTAHALIIIGSAIACAAIVASILPKGRVSRRDTEKGNIMTFAFSKLVALARGGTKSDKTPLNFDDSPPLYEADPAPVVRRSDAHPDAPPRSPVFARRELGAEALPPVQDVANDTHYASEPIVEDITGLSMPRAPEPLPWEKIEQEMDRLLAGARLPGTGQAIGAGKGDAMSLPSIPELAERLERGLAKRRARQEAAAHIAADGYEGDYMQDNQGLDEALAVLRNITARDA